MEVLSFDSFSLKDAITSGKVIGKNGSSGVVFLHGNNLIKLHKNLFSLINVNCRILANHVFKDVFRYNTEPFVKKEQIEYLLSLQPNITLTDFDKGIVLVNDRICGTILTPHLDYKDLSDYEPKSLMELLLILENILKALRELEENGISHLDLAMHEKGQKPTFNVLYKETDIKLCDLSGEFITYGENANFSLMYKQYIELMFCLVKKIKDNYPLIYETLMNIDYNTIESYDDAVETLDKVYKLGR